MASNACRRSRARLVSVSPAFSLVSRPELEPRFPRPRPYHRCFHASPLAIPPPRWHRLRLSLEEFSSGYPRFPGSSKEARSQPAAASKKALLQGQGSRTGEGVCFPAVLPQGSTVCHLRSRARYCSLGAFPWLGPGRRKSCGAASISTGGSSTACALNRTTVCRELSTKC